MISRTKIAIPRSRGEAICLIHQQLYSLNRFRKICNRISFAKKVIKNSASVKKFNTMHILSIFLYKIPKIIEILNDFFEFLDSRSYL